MPYTGNPRKQKITTNNFTKTKQEEKQTDNEKQNKIEKKKKNAVLVGMTVLQVTELIILAIVIVLCIH